MVWTEELARAFLRELEDRKWSDAVLDEEIKRRFTVTKRLGFGTRAGQAQVELAAALGRARNNGFRRSVTRAMARLGAPMVFIHGGRTYRGLVRNQAASAPQVTRGSGCSDR